MSRDTWRAVSEMDGDLLTAKTQEEIAAPSVENTSGALNIMQRLQVRPWHCKPVVVQHRVS